MGEWLAMDQWQHCAGLERPGIVFEVRNAEGQSMLTRCIVPLPQVPFDWKSPAVRFRAVVEPKPEHSAPMPEPRS